MSAQPEWRDIQQRLSDVDYIASDELAMALHLSMQLGRPLLLEGSAGVGKTEVAKALSRMDDRRLIRLQCYEGLDASTAIYEWNYQSQLLSIRATEGRDLALEQVESQIFSDKYLLKRPLLEAITQEQPAVLLIDEVDRADEEFEAYLLEILSDFQVSIPEMGTIKATSIPQVILTANGTRDLSDALRRRCLYSHVDYPDTATETAILFKHEPDIDARLAAQIVGFVQLLRKEDLEKKPGVAEMLDWGAALSGMGIADITDDPVTLQASLVCLLKTRADQAQIPTEVAQRLAGKLVP